MMMEVADALCNITTATKAYYAKYPLAVIGRIEGRQGVRISIHE
jgi:hypothetical protein